MLHRCVVPGKMVMPCTETPQFHFSIQRNQHEVRLEYENLVEFEIINLHIGDQSFLSFYALNPEVTGAQIAEPRTDSVQVSDAAVAILVTSRPELQMFANARMCFIPY